MTSGILSLSVPGKPVPLARHRHGKRGTFDPQYLERRGYANKVVGLLQRGYEAPSAIHLKLTYLFKPPKSWSKKKQAAAIGTPVLVVPDLSNLIKFTEDALNGILWPDDRLINRIEAEKRYDAWEGTIIEIFNAESDRENNL